MRRMTKQERKDRKLYRKQNKAFEKEIKHVLNNSGPWDYCYILYGMYVSLKRMKDYYSLGYNVHALENENEPPRLEVATRAVELFDHYYDVCDNFDWKSKQVEREDDALREVFKYLGDNIMYLWD